MNDFGRSVMTTPVELTVRAGPTSLFDSPRAEVPAEVVIWDLGCVALSATRFLVIATHLNGSYGVFDYTSPWQQRTALLDATGAVVFDHTTTAWDAAFGQHSGGGLNSHPLRTRISATDWLELQVGIWAGGFAGANVRRCTITDTTFAVDYDVGSWINLPTGDVAQPDLCAYEPTTGILVLVNSTPSWPRTFWGIDAGTGVVLWHYRLPADPVQNISIDQDRVPPDLYADGHGTVTLRWYNGGDDHGGYWSQSFTVSRIGLTPTGPAVTQTGGPERYFTQPEYPYSDPYNLGHYVPDLASTDDRIDDTTVPAHRINDFPVSLHVYMGIRQGLQLDVEPGCGWGVLVGVGRGWVSESVTLDTFDAWIVQGAPYVVVPSVPRRGLVSNLIDTDLPTNENFLTQHVSGVKINLHRRYAVSAPGIMTLCPIPPKFGTASLRNGVIGYYLAHDHSYTPAIGGAPARYNSTVAHLVAHPAGPAPGHKTGWVTVGNPIQSAPTTGFDCEQYCRLAAQWYGDTIVGVVSDDIEATGRSDGKTVVRRTSFVVLRDTAPVVVSVIEPIEAVGDITWQPITPLDLFVSDHADPFVWSLEPDGITGFRLSAVTAGTVGRFQWRSDATAHSSGYSGAFRHQIPAVDTAGQAQAIFVKPWSTDTAEAPELWTPVKEFNGTASTGRWGLYRSRWLPQQRPSRSVADTLAGRPQVLDDDAAYMSGHRQYPRKNKYGLAFESDWHRRDHLVGVIGPFPGANPEANLVQISIVRDRKRVRVLHLVYSELGDGGVVGGVYTEATNMWTSTSYDDGAHWAAPRQTFAGFAPIA